MLFWWLDNKKAVLFPRVCVRLRCIFTKKEKKNIFAKSRAAHAMPPGRGRVIMITLKGILKM